MNFDEKDSMLFDDEEKKTTGFPFIVVALLLCIIAGLVVFVLKHNGIDFNFKIPDTSSVHILAFTFSDSIVRITGTFFLVVSVRAAYRKMFLYDNGIYWYKIITGMIVGSILMIFGSGIIIFYAKSLAYVIYH